MDALARVLFDLSPAGIILFRPLYDAAGELSDFAYDQLNRTAQQLLRLPAQPPQTFRQLYPHAVETGIFAFYRDAFHSGEAGLYNIDYHYDGLNAHYQLLAQPAGDQLVVTFTDSGDQRQGDVAAALHLSYQREQQARAEAERQRQLLLQVFEQAPVPIAIFQGPDYQVELANPALAGMWGRTAASVVGRPVFQALPDLRGQGFEEMLAGVMRTGQTFTAQEVPAVLDRVESGQPALGYFNISYQALYAGKAAQPTGIIAVAVEVSGQVRARQQVQQLNEQLARAQAATERQRRELERVFEQAPIAIAVYRGPNYTIQLANSTVARLWGRTQAQLIGKGLFEALPEVAGMGYEQLLDGVMATGEPYVAHAMEARHEREGRTDTVYWDFVYVPTYEDDGRIDGAMVVANEVTEQVRARQRQQQLNDELEARVQERTRQLAEQQTLLNHILRQVPAAITTLRGPEHRYSFFNERYQQLVGHRAVLDKPMGEAMPEVVEQGFIELLDRVYATGEAHEGPETAVLLAQPGGPPQQHYVSFVYQPLFDEQGDPQGILVFAVDVTGQVRTRRQADTMQQALLAVAQRQALAREDLYQVFEQTPAAIALLRGPGHRIEYCNPAYQRLFPSQVLRGRLLADAHPQATAQGIVARLDHVYQTGDTYEGHELPLKLAAGPAHTIRTHYFNYTYQAYREQGEVVGVIIFATDVTEQVQARQQREQQQAELRRIFEQAPVAIAIMRGPRLVVELANSAVSAIWGRPLGQTIGRPYFEAVPDTAGQGFEEILAGVLATGRPFVITEAPVTLDRAHSGQPTQAFVNFVFQPLYDEHQVTVGLIAIGTEVTTQVLARQQMLALNAELTASNRQLTRSNADLDSFVYTASHDLKAPIANLEGLLDALRQELPPELLAAPTPAHLLALMEKAIARFRQTIGQLTDVARLTYDEALPAEPVDLAALVEDVRLDLAAELAATDARLTVDVAACPRVRFAPQHLRSIVYNLLSNAIKYHAPARTPEVLLRTTCTDDDGQFVLTVQDNGLGLDAEQQGKLFRLFKRLHAHVPGSGVGLYAVKKLVENAGGTIAVYSTPDVGTTFTVALPLT